MGCGLGGGKVWGLVLHIIRTVLQQGLEAGMATEGGATGILHPEDSVASPVNSRD